MSHKRMDDHKRWRNLTIAFRVSPEENELINARVAASGLTKQAFLTANMLNEKIIVHGSSRVYYGLKHELENVYNELVRLSDGSQVPKELIDLTRYIARIVKDMKEKPDA